MDGNSRFPTCFLLFKLIFYNNIRKSSVETTDVFSGNIGYTELTTSIFTISKGLLQMDFCSWCEGTKRSSELTAKGLSGGLCEEHQKLTPRTEEEKALLREVFKRLRGNK